VRGDPGRCCRAQYQIGTETNHGADPEHNPDTRHTRMTLPTGMRHVSRKPVYADQQGQQYRYQERPSDDVP
jgi:hypothetical protein